MGSVINNPEDMERFANELQQYVDIISDETGKINSSFNVLGDAWQDEKHAQFEEEFQSLVSQMNAFKDYTEEIVPWLRTLAARLREYQRT